MSSEAVFFLGFFAGMGWFALMVWYSKKVDGK
jgi:hypothetical protein